MRGSRLPGVCSSAHCRFSIALSPPARNGLWAVTAPPCFTGLPACVGARTQENVLLLFSAHAHFNTFCVLFLEVQAFSSPGRSSSGRFTRTAARLRRTVLVDGLIICVIALFEYPTAVEIVSTDIDTSSTWKYTPLATILTRIQCSTGSSYTPERNFSNTSLRHPVPREQQRVCSRSHRGVSPTRCSEQQCLYGVCPISHGVSYEWAMARSRCAPWQSGESLRADQIKPEL